MEFTGVAKKVAAFPYGFIIQPFLWKINGVSVPMDASGSDRGGITECEFSRNSHNITVRIADTQFVR